MFSGSLNLAIDEAFFPFRNFTGKSEKRFFPVSLINMKTNPFNTIMQLINSNDLRLLKKIAAMLYFYPIAKDPDHGVKVRQNFAFSFLIAFFIYLSGFDSFSFSKIPMTDSLDNFSLGTP